MIGWRAGSGRTMSEGLKGFPWPLMPPEILKPRPGFFSILTHNYREEEEGKKRKDRTRKERQVKVKYKALVGRQHAQQWKSAFMRCVTRFGSYIGGRWFSGSDNRATNILVRVFLLGIMNVVSEHEGKQKACKRIS